MRTILHPPSSSSSSNTMEDNDAPVVVPLPSTLPRYQRTPGNDDEHHHRPPASPSLLVSPAPASIPSHSSSVTLLLVLSAVTWHWGLGLGSLSSLSLLAGDDVAVGMLAVTWEGGRWLSSGDVAVIRVVLGVERGGDVAVVAVKMGWWSWQRRRRVVASDVAVLGRVGVDELAPGWPKCGR